MSSNISRRKIVAGAAWAAPVVAASSLVPAFAASTDCTDYNSTLAITAATASTNTAGVSSFKVTSGQGKLRVTVMGGYGGSSFGSVINGAKGGIPAMIRADITVAAGDTVKFIVANGGIGTAITNGDGTRENLVNVGGTGFGNGGNSGIVGSSPTADAGWGTDGTRIQNGISAGRINYRWIHAGSGGGASAILVNGTAVLIAGGAGGSGTRTTNPISGGSQKTDMGWNFTPPSIPLISNGGNVDNVVTNAIAISSETLTHHAGGTDTATVGGNGSQGVAGSAGTGTHAAGASVTYATSAGLSIATEPAGIDAYWQMAMSGVVTGAAGSAGSLTTGTNGADGVAAYGVTYPTYEANAPQAIKNFRVGTLLYSGGGGAGYGSGGSGAAVGIAGHQTDETWDAHTYTPNLWFPSTTAALSGGGGAGGSYVSSDLVSNVEITAPSDTTPAAVGERKPGAITVAYCSTSDDQNGITLTSVS